MRQAVLQKALLISIETDFSRGYIEGSNMLIDVVVTLIATISKAYDRNKRYDVLVLKQRVYDHVVDKHRQFLDRYDVHGSLRQHVQVLLMETISYLEDFKSLWISFFASDAFYDTVDQGCLDFNLFNKTILNQSADQLKVYTSLSSLLESSIFEDVWMKIKKFSRTLGEYVYEQYKKIGANTQTQLKRLDHSIKTSKFTTQHIVVTAVARLR